MAVTLKFHCARIKGGYLEVEKNQDNNLFLSITNPQGVNSIELDLSTAIKFSKELRRKIATVKEGANNA